MVELIIFRVLQGLGSGAIQTAGVTVLADMYDIDRRAKMLGLTSGFWGLASVIAPLLGGFIVQQLSWHWVFMINVPIGLLEVLPGRLNDRPPAFRGRSELGAACFALGHRNANLTCFLLFEQKRCWPARIAETG